MFKFLLLCALVGFGGWNWWSGKQSASSFDQNGKPMVRIFTFADCGKACIDALRQLNQTKIAYEELIVTQATTETEADKRWKKLGRPSFSTIVVGNTKLTNPPPALLKGALAQHFGDEFLTAREQRYLARHFNDAGKPQIVMYSASWCPYCVDLRNTLNAAKTPFVEVEVAGAVDKFEISHAMGISGYPTVYVGLQRFNSRDVSGMTSAAAH
jgi:glutaredoxin